MCCLCYSLLLRSTPLLILRFHRRISSDNCPAEKYCTCKEAHAANVNLELYPGYDKHGGCHKKPGEDSYVRLDCYEYERDESHREL